MARTLVESPQQIAEKALQLSETDDCIVITDEETTANLRWANNTLTTNGISRSRVLTVIAVVRGTTGTAAGVISRNGASMATAEEIVRAAEEAARSSAPVEDAQELVGPGESSGRWDDPPKETEFSVFAGFASDLGNAFQAARSQDRLLFGYAEHSMLSTFVASSSGLRLRHDQPTGFAEINAKPTDYSSSAWVGVPTQDFSDVDVSGLDEQLRRRLDWAKRTIEMPAGRYETLLPPSAVSDLIYDLYAYAGARPALEGRSVFSKPGGTRVGDRLTDAGVTLRSDPNDPKLKSAPFVVARASSESSSIFDNGLPLSPTKWIEDGVLRALVQTRHTAKLTGLPLTPRIGNIILEVEGSNASLDDMIRDSKRVLLLTSLFYIREVDPKILLLTGLTRDGVYLVENGEVVGAVNNFRFNESPVDMLKRITQAGASAPTLGREILKVARTSMPPLRVEGFNMSTVSQAL